MNFFKFLLFSVNFLKITIDKNCSNFVMFCNGSVSILLLNLRMKKWESKNFEKLNLYFYSIRKMANTTQWRYS